MAEKIVWEMSYETSERYHDAYFRYSNQYISYDEFWEEMLALPGCPFPSIPSPDANIHLHLRTQPKTMSRVPRKRFGEAVGSARSAIGDAN